MQPLFRHVFQGVEDPLKATLIFVLGRSSIFVDPQRVWKTLIKNEGAMWAEAN